MRLHAVILVIIGGALAFAAFAWSSLTVAQAGASAGDAALIGSARSRADLSQAQIAASEAAERARAARAREHARPA